MSKAQVRLTGGATIALLVPFANDGDGAGDRGKKPFNGNAANLAITADEGPRPALRQANLEPVNGETGQVAGEIRPARLVMEPRAIQVGDDEVSCG